MLEKIITIVVLICIYLPLMILLIQTFIGKRLVKKGELIAVLVMACVFLVRIIVQACAGNGYRTISGLDIYFMLLAVAVVLAYCRQKKEASEV